jgi:hypothetical protein
MATDQNEFAVPRGSAACSRLEFARGASRITIRVATGMDDLVRGRFEGAAPRVLADDGRVTIANPRLSPLDWLLPTRRSADIALNAELPWELVFGNGASKLRADLTGLSPDSFEIRSGASDLEVILPEPQSVVRVRIGGGASKVTLLYPPGVAVAVSIGGGVSKLAFGEQRFGAIGRRTHLESPDAREAHDRYEVEIGGGASRLTIGERKPVTKSTPVVSRT